MKTTQGTVSIGGRIITNPRFSDNIDGLAGSEQELGELVTRIDRTPLKFGMEINTEKTKLLVIGDNITADISIGGHKLETVNQFKYLGSIIKDE